MNLNFILYCFVLGLTFMEKFTYALEEIPILTFAHLIEVTEKVLDQNTSFNEETALKEKLLNYHGKWISMKGFLIKEGGEWMLSSQPSLRSCCISSRSKAASFVSLEGGMFNDADIKKILSIQGTFEVSVKRNAQKERIQLYRVILPLKEQNLP
jgi:hypothetical protein